MHEKEEGHFKQHNVVVSNVDLTFFRSHWIHDCTRCVQPWDEADRYVADRVVDSKLCRLGWSGTLLITFRSIHL